MNKEQFLKQLSSSLKRLPTDERQDILQDYEEHFAIGLEQGKTEEDIASSLGSPNQIAKEFLASYHLEKVESSSTAANILRASWAVIGLSFFNIIIVLGPLIVLTSLIISGWTVRAAFIVSPLLVLINTVINPHSFAVFDLFFSIILCGIGLFMVIGMFLVTKVVFRSLYAT
jgi:uncharacterized membrane protein